MHIFTETEVREIYNIPKGKDAYILEKLELANRNHAMFYWSLDLTNQKHYMTVVSR